MADTGDMAARIAELLIFFLVVVGGGYWLSLRSARKQDVKVHLATVLAGVECPNCHHVGAVSRITAGAKVTGVAAFGVFGATNFTKSMRCGNCTYTW
jgi:hypothetical protein